MSLTPPAQAEASTKRILIHVATAAGSTAQQTIHSHMTFTRRCICQSSQDELAQNVHIAQLLRRARRVGRVMIPTWGQTACLPLLFTLNGPGSWLDAADEQSHLARAHRHVRKADYRTL